MQLNKYLDELAKEWEVKEPFATQTPGVYAIPLEEGIKVMLTETFPGFQLSSNVIECPNKQEAFFTQALLANLFGQGTRGGVLGLKPDGKMVTITRVIQEDPNYKDFRNILEDFINSIDFWREEALNYK
jgi:hypothetical protein